MTDLSPACASHNFRFVSGIRRKIVMMEISLMDSIIFHIIQNQIFFGSAECDGRKHFSIASPEQS